MHSGRRTTWRANRALAVCVLCATSASTAFSLSFPGGRARRYGMNATRFKRINLLRIVLVFGLSAALCGPVQARAPKILMFGTSLTQGLGLPPGTELPAVLQAKLKAQNIQANVIN